MSKFDNIEKLFQETFEHYEEAVDPTLWNSIQSSVGAQAGAAASSGSGILGSVAGKIAAVVGAGAIVASSIYVITKEDSTPVNQEQVAVVDQLDKPEQKNTADAVELTEDLSDTNQVKETEHVSAGSHLF